jgi:chemotaxis protein MotB
MTSRRKRIAIPRQSHERWFVSYADFVTLLFAFFVVLFAWAQTDKMKILSRSLQATLDRPLPRPIPKTPELQLAMDFLSRQLRTEIEAGQMRVRLEQRGLVVSLSQAAFFPSGGDQLEPRLYPSIRKVADAVRDLPNPIRLEGHTDSQPIHDKRFRDNWELSAARALAMLQLLNGSERIARERLAIAGYADTAPITTNETEEGRSRNRRVDIVILSKGG